MANAPGTGRPFSPGREERPPEVSPPDRHLPENSKENLDAKLDHAIEETFPTSDPVSVTVTKHAIPRASEEAASASDRGEDQAGPTAAEKVLEHVKEALQDVAETTSHSARRTYERSRRYLRDPDELYSEAEQYYREGRRAAAERMAENPWIAPLVAGIVGYALAWAIHHQRRSEDRHVASFARTRRGYAPYRDDDDT